MKAFKIYSLTTVSQEMERWDGKAKPQTRTLHIPVPLSVPVPVGFHLGHMAQRISEHLFKGCLRSNKKTPL